MADVFDQLAQLADELRKGGPRGGKYYRRTPTGNPKKPWRYFYTKEQYEAAHGTEAHIHGPEHDKHADRELHVERLNDLPRLSKDATIPAGTRARLRIKDAHIPGTHEYEVPAERGGIGLSDSYLRAAAVDAHREKHGIRNDTALKNKGPYRSDDMSVQYSRYSKSHSSEETMRNLSLRKSLYSFTDNGTPGGAASAALKDEYLADYVDSFLAEAFEHERMERAHQDPNLLPAGDSPDEHLVNAVYGEFCAYSPNSKNLRRAQEKLGVDRAYVANRLRALNLVHVNNGLDANDAAAQVAGYHPQPMTLSMFAQAEHETALLKAERGRLADGPRQVQLDPGDNPLAVLTEQETARVQHYHGLYGAPNAPATFDADCLFHGRGEVRKSLDHSVVHGVQCTCSKA